MRTYRGTETVEPGLYFNLRQLSFKSVDEEGPLPGEPQDVYRRVPMLALLLVGPIMGLAFVVFLPFLAFAMVGWIITSKVGRLAATAGRAVRRERAPHLALVPRPGRTPAAAPAGRNLDRADRDAA
jgi:hypothetical protein